MAKTIEEKQLAQARKKFEKLMEQYPEMGLEVILESYFWPSNVDANKTYFVRSDDNDGLPLGISVSFSRDGDAHLNFASVVPPELFNRHCHRFRAPMGGPVNPKVHKALLILGFAIAESSKGELPGDH